MEKLKPPKEVFECRDWRISLVQLQRKGGVYAKAYQAATSLAYELRADINAWKLQNTTTNGCQIPKAIKIDLPGRARMVFIVDADYVFLLFAGDHESTDRWCERHKGMHFGVGKNREVIPVDPAPREAGDRVTSSPKPLLQLLPADEREFLKGRLPALHRKNAERLMPECSDDDIQDLVEFLPDAGVAELLFDVLISVRADNVQDAINRIKEFSGALVPVAAVPVESGPLVAGPGTRVLPREKEFYEKILAQLAVAANRRDWMLLLHPDQEAIVEEMFDGPALLYGIAGSGKTCVIVHRAVKLADRYPGESILIVTLNRALAALLQELVHDFAPESIRPQIAVKSFYDFCRGLLEKNDPTNVRQYLDVADKTSNHVDDVWREFYQCENNNRAAEILEPIHDSLISRGVDAEGYIREEFDLIRSIAPLDGRDKYLDAERVGRVHPLGAAWRKALLEGLVSWERKCWTVGVTDSLGMAVAVHRVIDRVQPEYRCVLVDEAQDFGSVELGLIRRLVKPGSDDMFLVGDLAQKISLKSRRFTDVGIDVPHSRRKYLSLNYRNSREILEVSSKMLFSAVPQENRKDDDFVYLNPDLSSFSGPLPRLLKEQSLERELSAAIAYANEMIAESPIASVCIALAGYSEFEVEEFARQIECSTIRGIKTVKSGSWVLSDLESTKGFEFHQMIVLNLTAGQFPSPRCPQGEEWRDACRLYVAMTRARTELILSYHGELSPTIAGIKEEFLDYEWSHYVDEERPTFGLPKRLESIRWDKAEAVDQIPLADCTAAQFLYREEARGLDVEFTSRLRQLVTGSRRTVDRKVHEWRTLGELIRDISQSVSARRVAGAATVERLRQLADAHGIDA